MNLADHRRINDMISQTDRLMDAPREMPLRVSNVDVIEAMLGDLRRVEWGQDPVFLTELLDRLP